MQKLKLSQGVFLIVALYAEAIQAVELQHTLMGTLTLEQEIVDNYHKLHLAGPVNLLQATKDR